MGAHGRRAGDGGRVVSAGRILPEVVDAAQRARTLALFRERGLVLPTFDELAEPATIAPERQAGLEGVDPDAADARNLFRVHWHNAAGRRDFAAVPEHVVFTKELTGVDAPIVVLLGNRFPMIGAHKVLAAYGCLVPRLVTGAFDPEQHRAIWPSTGNYCRGGVAISTILGCRGVAVLPEGMSAERFEWLREWVAAPEDVIRTPGTESNVKEIYDECARLAADPANVVFNQFCEFGNHLVHYHCTGRAFESVYRHLAATRPELKLAAFVSATGSAGTIAAGDRLKELFGTRIAAVEALECPTMLENGFGEHNIQGIGDKHIPFVHNVTNTDAVVGISDKSTDALNAVFANDLGRDHLSRERGVPAEQLAHLADLGLSSICNLLASIDVARELRLGPEEAVFTVATDGASMYATEIEGCLARDFGGRLDAEAAARTLSERLFERHLEGGGERVELLGEAGRRRVFNLGYFTWVEQQGVSLEDFEARRSQAWWQELRAELPRWNELIEAFNAELGAGGGA